MNIAPDCRNSDDLQRFLLGQLPAPDAEQVQAHLAACPKCLDTVSHLQATDTLVEAMRAQAQVAAQPEVEAVENLIDKLSGLFRTNDTSAVEATTPGGLRVPRSSSHLAAPANLLVPPQAPDELGRLGGYRVLRVLGAGGMGIVFEAEDPQLKRRVALKVMRPELAQVPASRERFLREAQAAAAIEHDHIVTIHQVGEDRGVPYLAMPLLKGETLEDALRRAEGISPPVTLPLADALRITREIAAGLAAAHAAGLTHRDIKPANIWLEKSGRVKILDFGLARPEQDDAHLTQTGSIAGTPQYMAPEQAAGQPVNHHSDLFSLGCVLYRLLTGRLPFGGPNTMAVLRALALEQPQPPHEVRANVPRALSGLTMRLLAKEPPKRPQSAEAVAESLAEIEDEARRQSAPTKSAGRRIPLLAAAVALLVLASIAAWFTPAVYRIVTNQGLLVIQTDDPDVKVAVKQKGELVQIVDRRTGKEVNLKAGTYQLELSGKKRDGLKLQTSQFTLTRGGNEIVKVWREPLGAATLSSVQPFPPPASVEHFPPTPLPPASTAPQPRPTPPPLAAAQTPALAYGPPEELLKIQLEPAHMVLSVDFSPDAQRAVISNGFRVSPGGKKPAQDDANFNVRIWDLKTGTESAQLPGFTASVSQAAFSPTHDRVLAFGSDRDSKRTLREWDVASKLEIGKATTPAQATSAVVLSAERRQVIFGATDGKLRLWSLEPGMPNVELEGHVFGPIAAVAMSADGKWALSAGATRLGGRGPAPDYALRLWDLQDAKEVGRLEGHTNEIRSLEFSRDGSLAISAGLEALILWDIPTRQLVTRTSLHNLGLVTAVLCPDAHHALTGSGDGTLRLWDLTTSREIWRDRGPAIIIDVALSSDGNQALVGYGNGAVRLLSLLPADAPPER